MGNRPGGPSGRAGISRIRQHADNGAIGRLFDAREGKVREISNRIGTGTYIVDSEKVARKMVDGIAEILSLR